MQVGIDHPLLATKLYIPPARPQRVPRARLIARMNEAVQGPLTLVCAPAGYGKTTLLSEWIPQNEHCVTWVSLDEDDNDPVRFWRYFIAALQTLNPQLCTNPRRVLESTPSPQMETVLSLVINELAALDYRFSQVIDDYHLVENQAIDSSLVFLIEHLPANVSLVVTSRSDPAWPLARWRARRQLAEIRSADLRFTAEETTVLLNQALRLDLSPPEIDTLVGRTEGWAVGLQLAGLSIKDHEDRSGFIAAFAGSHRFVIDYLVEEVLSQQAEPIREFLLATSILSRLCASLCDALTGSGNGQTVLEGLEQANLFVVPLDDHRAWYRYHHLFSEVLQARLRQDQPEIFVELHCRASAWFEQQGLMDYAIRHALAAPDIERAVRLVEENSLNMLQQSEILLIRSWLEQLPHDLVQTRPRLILAYGWTLILTGYLDAVDSWLTAPQASAALSAPDLPADVLGELVLFKATLARFQHQDARSLELAEEALELLSGDHRGLQAGAMYTIGVARLRLGDMDTAGLAFSEAVRLGERRGGPYMALIALQELSELQIKQGRLSQAIRTCQRAMSMADRGGWQAMPAAGLAHIYSGQALYERNDLSGAALALSSGVELLLSSIEQFILAQGFVLLAQVHLAGGSVEEALAALRRGEEWFAQMNVADTGAGVLLAAGKARLWLAQGNLRAAEHWAESSRWLPEDTDLGYFQAVTRVRLCLAQNRRSPEHLLIDEAAEIMSRLLAQAEARSWRGQVIELSLLAALVCRARNDAPGAWVNLERALLLAEPEGYVRKFVDLGEPVRLLLLDYLSTLKQPLDGRVNPASIPHLNYIQELLVAFPGQTHSLAPASSVLLDPLTEREQEILRLLSEGYSNREIAAQLIVALSTVKSHINSLYSKLGTHRRTQAIAIARDLGLL